MNFEKAKELVKAKPDLIHEAEAVYYGANTRRLKELMKALLVDPQTYKETGKVIVTPIAYMLFNGIRGIDEVYTPPGKILITKDHFSHEAVVGYHKYLMEYLIDQYSGRRALFTPCSSTKPYRKSFMYLKIERLLESVGFYSDGWRFTVSEPLVLVPRFLDVYYPAAHYDLPPQNLTEEEKEFMIRALSWVLKKLSTRFEVLIYSLPRTHKYMFEEAMKRSGVNANYSPYNVFHLPRLKAALQAL